jgi:hypothetical protein
MAFLSSNTLRSLSLWLFVGVVCLPMLACPGTTKQTKKDESLPGKNGLRFRLNRFNQLLRWNHFQGAKQFVLPKLRSRYILLWERERDLRKIAGFSIRDVTWNEKGSQATVLVVTQEYRSNVMSVRKIMRQQTWKAFKGDWYFAGEKDAKATLSKPGS